MLTLLLLSSAFLAQPQPQTSAPPDPERVAYLESSAVRIRSIDPDHDDFADLEPLKQLIGDARIVQLGEQTHGDGAVFLAKCRLIKFLHQEMGFDVLVWESGLFDCREADRAIRTSEMPILDATWKQGIFGIWALSAQAQPILHHCRETAKSDRPLETAGYDCQFSGGDPGRWLDRIGAFFSTPLGEAHPSRHVIAAIRSHKNALTGGEGIDEKTFEGVILGLENLAGLADAARDELVKAHGQDEFTFMRRTIDDAAATARMSHGGLLSRLGKEGHMNHRDQRMGENLIWLANEKYKGRKLIVWAATMHEVTDVEAIRPLPPMKPDMYAGSVTAGTVAKKGLGDAMYTVGFDAHRGRAGICFGGQWPIQESPENSFGALCAAVDHPFLFVDFRSTPADHWLRSEDLIARPLGYAPMTADWSRQLDAMLFIHTMIPSTQQDTAPADYKLTVD